MDHLWSPWRYRYVTTASPKDECIFCAVLAQDRDAENYVVHRARHNFVMLNRYPYTSGHVMVAPYVHVPTLEEAPEEALTEMILLMRDCEKYLRALYRAEGLNLGLNIGRSAGAGVAGHIHAHVLPRWIGDANFMTATGETRVLPEDLQVTYDRLLPAFRSK
jgi:ATP adenylyltransferase